MPNEALPESFLALAYDLPDIWNTNPACYNWGCCRHNAGNSYNTAKCASSTQSLGGVKVCERYCSALEGTPAFTIGICVS